MSWGWRKILQVSQVVRPFMWARVRNGSTIFAWHDTWTMFRHLAKSISNRDIYTAGFSQDTKVPHLIDSKDEFYVRNRDNLEVNFSVAEIWNCIRHRNDEVNWFNVVWFQNRIPRHAIHVWLVIKRKLKTQELLRNWDVNTGSSLVCLFCSLVPDSHEHLFFDCTFTSRVWLRMVDLICMPNIPSNLVDIVDYIIPFAHKRTLDSTVCKLVFVATCYFIWIERNARLFRNKTRTLEQIIDITTSSVRNKLLSCVMKKSPGDVMLLNIWKLPNSVVTN
ncbi:hypothetical protein Tco_1558069 [Tanacetum coccineum]